MLFHLPTKSTTVSLVSYFCNEFSRHNILLRRGTTIFTWQSREKWKPQPKYYDKATVEINPVPGEMSALNSAPIMLLNNTDHSLYKVNHPVINPDLKAINFLQFSLNYSHWLSVPLFTSTTGKRVFWTGRALADIIAFYICPVPCMK